MPHETTFTLKQQIRTTNPYSKSVQQVRTENPYNNNKSEHKIDTLTVNPYKKNNKYEHKIYTHTVDPYQNNERHNIHDLTYDSLANFHVYMCKNMSSPYRWVSHLTVESM